ncbi:hypothetical protein SLE2022_120960 [Rubroshorea leprosula]
MDSNRAEAERWLGMAERLLASRDLHGTRTFAIRVRDFNPILADQILAVADTLLAAQPDPIDWYRILQLAPLTQSTELIATQYRKLALLLNPARNNILYADQAFRLVSDAWSVLSNPSKKAIYDSELRLGQLGRGASQPGFVTQLDLASQLEPQVIHLGLQQHHQHPQQYQQPPQPQQYQQPPQPQQPQQLYQHQQQPQRETPTTPVRRTEQLIQFGQPREPQQHLPQQREIETQVRKTPRSKDGRAALEEERVIVSNRPESTRNSEPTRRTQISQTESTRPSSGHQTEPARSTRPNESTPTDQATRPKVPSFWTACPYCFVLYEYPKIYEECTLRCQKCKRAFHAATIPSPPESGNATYFCCWGFFPIGCSGKQRNKNSGPRVYYDDDDLFVEISDTSEDSDEDDWEKERRKKRTKSSKARGAAAKKQQSERVRKGSNLESGKDFGGGSTAPEGPPVAESSRRGLGNGRRQMRNGAKDLGKLDLNVEFSNEVEEPALGRREGNGAGYGEEDNIEGNGFFEGLDEFLSSLPILSVVGDDKVKAT